MLRRWSGGSEPGVAAPGIGTPMEEAAGSSIRTRKRGHPAGRRLAIVVTLLLAAATAFAFTQKDRYADDLANLSRRLIGDENTARLESVYFRAHDRFEQVKYRVFGGDEDPFAHTVTVEYVPRTPGKLITIDLRKPRGLENPPVPEIPAPAPPPPPPAPLVLPAIRQLSAAPLEGEGAWTTAGLPHTSPDDLLMAKTFVRPDPARPYASVAVLLMDIRRVRLHLVGGVKDPGGDRGVAGPGAIPADHASDLLAAWNGGFQGPHGGFGMVANGNEYRPLRNGLASIAAFADGTVKMGEWGRTLAWEDGMAGVRQNAVLLVENCEVSRRTSEGNDTWGYVEVNSSEFITWRSAVGLTAEGNLLVAAGNSLSAATLAAALQAAGACTAMQLDINSPYVLTSLYFAQADGSLKPERFIAAMPDTPTRFTRTQDRDFMYVTLDESRYR